MNEATTILENLYKLSESPLWSEQKYFISRGDQSFTISTINLHIDLIT